VEARRQGDTETAQRRQGPLSRVSPYRFRVFGYVKYVYMYDYMFIKAYVYIYIYELLKDDKVHFLEFLPIVSESSGTLNMYICMIICL